MKRPASTSSGCDATTRSNIVGDAMADQDGAPVMPEQAIPERRLPVEGAAAKDVDAARAERSSDAHDPDAKAAWIGLLSFLSDEELRRYGDIARDQLDKEWQRGALQWSCGVGGLILIAGAGAGLIWGWVAFGTALVVAAVGFWMDLWAWKKVKARRLWRSHIAAVGTELAKRKSDGLAAQDPLPQPAD